MAVTVKIPTQLRAATGGEAEIEASGSTVGEVLDSVFEAHGDLRERITQDGNLRRFVNVYVSGEEAIEVLKILTAGTVSHDYNGASGG